MVVFAILGCVGAALTIVLSQLRKAPIGYEDHEGFHVVQEAKGSAVLRRYREPGVAAAGTLKGARAHS